MYSCTTHAPGMLRTRAFAEGFAPTPANSSSLHQLPGRVWDLPSAKAPNLPTAAGANEDHGKFT